MRRLKRPLMRSGGIAFLCALEPMAGLPGAPAPEWVWWGFVQELRANQAPPRRMDNDTVFGFLWQ